MAEAQDASIAERVRDARAAGRLDEALHLALHAWRATPHPVIGDVVERLDHELRAATPRGGPQGRTKAAFHSAWCELARDAGDTPARRVSRPRTARRR